MVNFVVCVLFVLLFACFVCLVCLGFFGVLDFSLFICVDCYLDAFCLVWVGVIIGFEWLLLVLQFLFDVLNLMCFCMGSGWLLWFGCGVAFVLFFLGLDLACFAACVVIIYAVL